jgi:hypothetical protein
MKSARSPSPPSIAASHESEMILQRTSQLRQASDELGSLLPADPPKETQDGRDYASSKYARTNPRGELVRARCPVVEDARACSRLKH